MSSEEREDCVLEVHWSARYQLDRRNLMSTDAMEPDTEQAVSKVVEPWDNINCGTVHGDLEGEQAAHHREKLDGDETDESNTGDSDEDHCEKGIERYAVDGTEVYGRCGNEDIR
mmetsp:Transcript_13904/g.13679  ORF Transcript_13904/g.13679 Transcript_13904/m.13679 type:complete len:114 (+) Transcript_13904:146-487(+)